MRVQVVLHQADFLSLRILRRQLFKEQGVFAFASLVINLREAFSGLGFDGRQERARPMLLIFVMLFAGATSFQRERRDRVADQETGTFIEANYRETSIERQ